MGIVNQYKEFRSRCSKGKISEAEPANKVVKIIIAVKKINRRSLSVHLFLQTKFIVALSIYKKANIFFGASSNGRKKRNKFKLASSIVKTRLTLLDNTRVKYFSTLNTPDISPQVCCSLPTLIGGLAH